MTGSLASSEGVSVRRREGHERRARRTAEQIMSAALEVFAECGFRDATLEAIAIRAEVAPASIYNHFGNKAGLARALGERALAAHEAHVSTVWTLDVSPLERLIHAGGATLRFSRDEPMLFRAMALAYLDPMGIGGEGPADHRIEERLGLQRDRLAGALEDGVRGRELRPLEVAPTVEFLIGAWTGVITMGMRRRTHGETSEALAAGVRALAQGLAGPAALTQRGLLRARYRKAIDQALTPQ